jgi:hypothetical protein
MPLVALNVLLLSHCAIFHPTRNFPHSFHPESILDKGLMPAIGRYSTPYMLRLGDFTDPKAKCGETARISVYKTYCVAQLMNFSAHGVLIDSAGRTFLAGSLSNPSVDGET